MAYNEECGANHHDFLQWALSNEFQINGVTPCRFAGRGMGMIATRTIEVSYTPMNLIRGGVLRTGANNLHNV